MQQSATGVPVAGGAMNSDDKNREAEPAREAEQSARQQAHESEEAELTSLLLRLRHKSAADVAIKTADTDMKSATAYLAETHLEQQKKTNRMLDNIQRHRIPPPLADS